MDAGEDEKPKPMIPKLDRNRLVAGAHPDLQPRAVACLGNLHDVLKQEAESEAEEVKSAMFTGKSSLKHGRR